MIEQGTQFGPEVVLEAEVQQLIPENGHIRLVTPRGEFPQEDFDSSGLGGEELQRHRSTWEPEDLERRGYRVVVMRAFHGPWNEAFVAGFGAEAPPVDALLAFKDLG